MSTFDREQADHRAVEVFERCAKVASHEAGDPAAIYRFEREATEEVILDAAIRFWARRGYAVPRDANR